MRTLALGLALHLLASATASPQTPPASPAAEEPPVFGEEIDVRVVNVEAVVTDRAGNRVPDLKAEDFRLKIDGREIPVSFFSEIREGRATASPDGEGPANESAGEPVGTSYLVFIDDYFATKIRRNEVLAGLQKDLAHLGPGDSMAVIAFDGARLTRLSDWSRSTAELGQVFDRAAARPARGMERANALQSFESSEDLRELATRDGDPSGLLVLQTAPQPQIDPTDLSSRMSLAGLGLQQRAYGEELTAQLKRAVAAAVSAMRGAGAPDGRKVMLLLSGGWPFSVQSFIEGGSTLGLPSHELKDGEALYRQLTSTANLLGYTIYPVDVPGIEAGAASATTFGPPRAGANPREQEVEGSLSFIAQETGGRALRNSVRLAALAVAAEDVRSYYWLGFTPTWKRNDRRHEIAVSVVRPGLKVRSRTSFLDLSRQAETSLLLESALLLGRLPDAAAMPIRVGTPVRNAKRKTTEIPVTLGLPVPLLTLVEQNGKFRAHVELRAVATNKYGIRSGIPVVSVYLSSKKAPKPNDFVKYETRLVVQGTASHIVVAISDVLSGKIATAEFDF
jgi:VWFA-related protein